MGHIFLVRHGQDEDNADKILNGQRNMPLTLLGRSQARDVGNKLKDNQIQVIYSSPLKRAYETASIIAAIIGIKTINILEELIERDFGVLTGKLVSEIPSYASKTLQTDGVLYFLEAEGAEDFPTLLERGRRALSKIEESNSKENVLLVTHGDIGKMIRAAYHGWDWKEALETPYFANTGVLELRADTDTVE